MLALCLLSWNPYYMESLCDATILVETVPEISALYSEYASTLADISSTTPGILWCFSQFPYEWSVMQRKNCSLPHIPARAFVAWPKTKVRKLPLYSTWFGRKNHINPNFIRLFHIERKLWDINVKYQWR